MFRSGLIAVLCFALAPVLPAAAQNPAPTPPMGWNSWDSYGLTIDEADYRANTIVLTSIRQFGWQYSVIDEGWYMQDPFANTVEARKYLWNENGILIPDAKRFPSSALGAGFKPVADWVHSQGLKFGIHIVRGIPRQVVAQNLPIASSSFHAADAADTTSPCPWDEGNWGVKDNPAGQAYYDSMLKLYADWGLDYIKVDCISDHPYRVDRDPPDCRSHPQNRPPHRAQPLARPHPAGPRRRNRQIRADVAHHRRSLGRLDLPAQAQLQRIPLRPER